MKSRRPFGLRLAFAASLVIAGAVGVAYATGAIFGASANVQLVACIDDKGTVRAVDDEAQCDKKEGAVKLQRYLEPQSVTVDCAAGNTIGAALAAAANNPAKLTITVAGTCTETVVIRR